MIRRSAKPSLWLVGALVTGLLLIVAQSSRAAAPGVAWRISQQAVPTALVPGSVPISNSQGKLSAPKLHLRVTDVGAAAAASATLVDQLPADLTTSPEAEPEWVAPGPEPEIEGEAAHGPCSISGHSVTCEITVPVKPGTSIDVYVPVQVALGEEGIFTNEVSVSAPGIASTARQLPTTVNSAPPSFAFSPGEEGVAGGAFDVEGDPPPAGSHPYMVEFTTAVTTDVIGAGTEFGEAAPTERLRSLGLELPAGVVVNPRATSVRCSHADFELGEDTCPAESQIGQISTELLGAIEGARVGLYNLEPEPGVPAEFGFNLAGASIVIRGGLSGGFRLTASSTELLARFPIPGVRVQLWGTPSDQSHDWARISELKECQNAKTETGCVAVCPHGCAVQPSPRPLLTMPSTCSASLSEDARAVSWLGSSAAAEAEFRTRDGAPESVEGCAKVGVSPSVDIRGTSPTVDEPTGLSFDLTVPQNESLGGLATATVKKVSVNLPRGMAVNPPAANGLGACSEGQIGLGDASPATCPDNSKVGTAEIVTPLLETPLSGSVFIAQQQKNPFGTLLALYLVVEGDGVVIKLAGRVDADSQTGQLTATFDNNPQLPFSNLHVQFNGGPRATLVTPPNCGVYTAKTEVTSWASATPIALNSPIAVDQGCSAGGFSPKLEAGTANPVAGRYSPFTLRITRQDGEQNLSRVSATLPEGLLAKLSGVPLCADSLAVAGNCPSASQVGTTTAGVGAGSMPLYIPQAGKAPTAVYLAGPYKGAPYSLVVAVPAQAGPFDLGKIAVRVALSVDPFTAQVTASSDPLPQILEGIPVAYRDVRVEASRSQFVLNPTSCEPKAITSTLISAANTSASPSAPFQATDCSSLGFKPQLKLSLKGSTKRTGHPALKAVVTYPKKGAYANIARAQVNLPHSVFLDQSNLNKTCTKPVLLSGNCPKTTIYGKAKAWTPLLEKPLAGPVYLVGGFGYKLPALVADLNGQLRILLKGKVDSGPNKGIRNTFEAVPDAPVSRFLLELKGGKKYSLLENSEPLCKKRQRAIARFTAQNGLVEQMKPKIAVNCPRLKHSKDG